MYTFHYMEKIIVMYMTYMVYNIMIVVATRYYVMGEEIPKWRSRDMWQVHNFIYVMALRYYVIPSASYLLPMTYLIAYNINKNHAQVTFTPPKLTGESPLSFMCDMCDNIT